jgi:actin cytoskeleton-regulatory complex protein SLA1
MSADDIRYVEKITASQNKRSESSPGPRGASDDDEPLATRRRSLRLSAKATPPPQKKKLQVDWFEFFLNAGCDVDDCTRYSDAFERDKIDQAILGDITEGTMRSLGLREGDIIRVRKHIEMSRPKSVPPKDESVQLRNDEELARVLQEEENSGSKRTPAPNLFAGPNGVLKNNTQRRGRPTPSKTLPPTSVDASAISNASETIKRTGSPSLLSPSSSPSQGPVRAGSVPPISGGFDDDAWTNRPSSTKPLTPTPTPPIQSQSRTASAPPRPPSEPLAAPTVVETKSAPTPQQDRTGKTEGGLAKTTEDDVFNQLARLASLRTQSPVVTSPPTPQRPNLSNNPSPSPAVVSPPPGFGSGMGIGNSPLPIGQLQSSGLSLQPQLTAAPNLNGPRGPFAPVPANQGLLHPLVPTRTGFTGFIPTALSNNPGSNPVGIGGGLQSQQSIFPQQTGFVNQPVISNPTGFPTNGLGQTQGFLPQQTGFPNATGFQTPSPGLSVSPVPPLPNFQPTGLLSNPTGFPSGGPGFGGFGGIQSSEYLLLVYPVSCPTTDSDQRF